MITPAEEIFGRSFLVFGHKKPLLPVKGDGGE